jgi:hypothetical protein
MQSLVIGGAAFRPHVGMAKRLSILLSPGPLPPMAETATGPILAMPFERVQGPTPKGAAGVRAVDATGAYFGCGIGLQFSVR